VDRTTCHRVRVAVAAGSAVLLLVGCQDGAPSGGGPTAASSPITSSPTSATPSVEPATGPVVEERQFTVRVPRGYVVEDKVFTLTSTRDRSSSDGIYVAAQDAPGLENLSQAVRVVLRSVSVRPKPERVDDVVIGGEPAYHLAGRSGAGNRYHSYGLVRGGQLLQVIFELDGPDARADEIVGSVLATWEWR